RMARHGSRPCNRPEASTVLSAPMAATDIYAPVETPPTPVTFARRGRWIDRWDPDDQAFWEASGKRIARKNLLWSVFAEHIGFSIWVLWTTVVINLANAGLTLSVSEQFLLTLVPNAIGSALRIPYTFAVPKFGGRKWTVI